jgi:site-specific DNA-methyltransferase (adenine-specific)
LVRQCTDSAYVASHAIGRDLINTLYYGDNLEILSRFISDETVDVVYLDPPFNKNKAYSVIFRDESGRTSDAQMATFEDYWHWGPTPARHYEFLTNSSENGGRISSPVSELIGSLHSAIRPSPLLAYLVEMCVRLVELRRVLKATGTLYLHCDPTASHYLKLLLDAIFGPTNFLNEIVWRRSTPKGNTTRRLTRNHDVILSYTKDARMATWHPQHLPGAPGRTATKYSLRDADGRAYQATSLLNPNPDRPNLVYEFKGVTRTWRWTQERMAAADQAGLILTPKGGGVPRFKRYLDEQKGIALDDVWTDIQAVNAMARERLGYPTQKPVALLNRIIEASSKPGDIILDPFCGCGTAIASALGRGRRWIGIDISNLAVQVIQDRMARIGIEVPVFDWPTEMDGVRRMIESPGGRHRFEAWALTRLNAQPVRELGGKGSDQGIDGRIRFTLPSGRVETIIVSVKSGHVGSPAVRDLKGTVQREHAAMGLLFTLQEPGMPMKTEAATAGFFRGPSGVQYPRIVLHTVSELLEHGQLPNLPSHHGAQSEMWPPPIASGSVRVQPAPRPAHLSPAGPNPPNFPAAAREIRQAYSRRSDAVSSRPVRPPRGSKPGRPGSQPSPESVDTD